MMDDNDDKGIKAMPPPSSPRSTETTATKKTFTTTSGDEENAGSDFEQELQVEAFLYTPSIKSSSSTTSSNAPRRSVITTASVVSVDGVSIESIEDKNHHHHHHGLFRHSIPKDAKKSRTSVTKSVTEGDEEGQDLENDDDKKDEKNDGNNDKLSGTRKLILGSMCFFLLLLGAIIGVVLGMRNFEKEETDSSPPSSAAATTEPTAIPVPAPITAAPIPTSPIAPSPSPSAMPTSVQFSIIFNEVQRYFPDLIYHSQIDPANYQAAQWMAEHDTWMSFPIDTDDLVAQFEFRRRYALVVFYFATGGGDGTWTNECNFLNATAHICDWKVPSPPTYPIELQYDALGVTCVNGEVRVLEIAYNNLQGTIPPEISGLPNLSILTLAGNALEGLIPWNRFSTTLQYLDVGFNQLTGNIYPLSDFTRLQFLYIDGNLITGTLPSSIYLTLKNIVVKDNLMTGTLPSPRVTTSSPFNQMFLGENQFEGTIPTSLGLLRELTDFSALDNNLTGSVPWSDLSSNLLRLRTLTLSNNQLTGDIFLSNIWSFQSLSQIFLSNNAFTGSIDSRIGRMSNLLVSFDVGNNSVDLGNGRIEGGLTGSIPTEIGFLTRLQNLNLRNNNMNGSLPTELGLLTQLRFLLLNNNNFVGKIPTQLDQLSNIVTLFLQGNRVSGNLEGVCAVRQVLAGGLGFRSDCSGGAVSCSCCSECCELQGLNCAAP